MAAPVATGHVTSQSDSFATTFAVTMPATVDAGNVLFILVQNCTNDNSINTPSGWELIFNEASGADSTARFACFCKIAVGNEDGATVNVTKAGGTGCRFIAQAWRVTGKTFTLADIEWPTAAEGTDDNPNPPSVDPSWAGYDTLFIAVAGTEQDANTPTAPSGYGSVHDSVNSSDGRVMSAELAVLDNDGSAQNPGVFTLTAGSTAAWVASTIAIRGDEVIEVIERTIGPVVVEYSLPTMSRSFDQERALGPVAYEYAIPALDVDVPLPGIDRTIGPVPIEYTPLAPSVSYEQERALGPVVEEYTVPAMGVEVAGDVPIGPVVYEYALTNINPAREVKVGPVAYEYSLPALHFLNEGVVVGPVPYEYALPTMDASEFVNRTLGPVLYEYGIPLLQGDYEILRDLGPVLYVYTVNPPNRKTTPVVIRQVVRYPVVFVHSEAWPRHQLAVLTSAHGIDRSYVAMQPGRNGRDTQQAQLSISSRDAQLAPDVLKHGQLIVIESAGFPVWAGPILGLEEEPRSGTIEISALGIEALLDGRVTRQPERFVNSIGELAVLRTLLDQANARNPTGIIASLRMASGQPIRELQTGGQSVMEALNEMTTRAGSEWWVEVNRTPRKVDATLHLGYRQGIDLASTLHLYEGVHFTGRYKSDLSQVKQSVVVVGDFGQELDERASVAHGFTASDFGTFEGVREKVRRASLSMPARNERVEYELMTGNARELAASAARAHERPLGAGEMFQDVFYLPVVDAMKIRQGNRWTRHGTHKGDPMIRTARMLSVQPDEDAGTALVISEVVV